MADIELVIKIPDYTYTHLCNGGNIGTSLMIENAIRTGTLLPKGHGDIIDRNKIEYMRAIHDLKWGKITASECSTKIKYSAPTIIEADKEQEDGNDD